MLQCASGRRPSRWRRRARGCPAGRPRRRSATSGLSAGRITSWSGFELHVLQVLGDRLAGDGHAVAVQKAAVEQRLHQHRHAARFPHVLGDVIGRPASGRRDRACCLKISATSNRSNLMPASCAIAGRCSAGVGRAAGGGDDHGGVLERLAGADVARADVAARAAPSPPRPRRARSRRGARRAPARPPNRAAPGRSPRRRRPWCWR